MITEEKIMSKENFNEEIKNIFTMLRIDILELYDNIEDSCVYFEEIQTLRTRDFILNFNEEFYIFILTFTIDLNAKFIAKILTTIYNHIEPEEIEIIEDSYWDVEKQVLLYGDEAKNKKNSELLLDHGYDMCVLCECVIPVDYISSETKICASCAKHYNDYNWC